jgi:predicted PolB exonuclease-like 3'-5' exonuclease
MIYITEVRMSQTGGKHEHIEAVRWEHRGSPDQTGESTVEEMIDWIENKEGFIHVRDGEGHDVPVRAVRPEGMRAYIRTSPDARTWKDDLLNLPRYGVKPGEVA